MGYFKGIVNVGHWGTGRKVTNSLYIQAHDALAAMDKIRKLPSVKHGILPRTVMRVSETEYVINSCIQPNVRHYDRELVPHKLSYIRGVILRNVAVERKYNEDEPRSPIVEKLHKMFGILDSLESNEDRAQCTKAINDFLISNFENQEEIIAEAEGSRVKI